LRLKFTPFAQTYYPPPNGQTGAGDVEINTGFTWGPNAPYDFASVVLHETGHSFGLKDLQNSPSVENTQYGGVRSGLMPGDIAGIQAIYGPRTPDLFQSSGRGTSAETAIDVTAQLLGDGQATIESVSLATIGDTEYFSFVAPAGSNESLQATAVASGISSLSPRITVYDAAMNPLGAAGDPTAWSNSPTVNLGNIQPGQRYNVAVTGATNDVFAVGAYALKLNVSGLNTIPPAPISPPAIPPITAPNAPQDPTPITATGSQDPTEPGHSPFEPIRLGTVTKIILAGQNLDSASDINLFYFQAARSGTTVVAATGATMIRAMNPRGQIIASGFGSVSLLVPRPGTPYYVLITSGNGTPVSDYILAIATQKPQSRISQDLRSGRSHQDVPTAHPSTIHSSLASHDVAHRARVGWKPVARIAVVNDRLRTHPVR